MKKRKGFVSNSSSSSFLIDISDLNDDDKDLVLNHITHAIRYAKSIRAKKKYGYDCVYGIFSESDKWNINEFNNNSTGNDILIAETIIDNFDFKGFLLSYNIDIIGDISEMNYDEMLVLVNEHKKKKLNKKLKKLK